MRAAALRNVFAPHTTLTLRRSAERPTRDGAIGSAEGTGGHRGPHAASSIAQRRAFIIQREAEEQMERAARRDSTTERIVTF